MIGMIVAITARDLKLAMRRQADIVSVLFFFIIVASLFPLGIGPEPQLLKKLAPGVLWVGALLATMLSLPRLFADDYRDGTLEQHHVRRKNEIVPITVEKMLKYASPHPEP